MCWGGVVGRTCEIKIDSQINLSKAVVKIFSLIGIVLGIEGDDSQNDEPE